jgi:hypothetical protein
MSGKNRLPRLLDRYGSYRRFSLAHGPRTIVEYGREFQQRLDDLTCYNCSVHDSSQRKKMSVRVIREGESEAPENDWTGTSPEERIEAVWMLTKLCMAWNEHSNSEPRLQRTVPRLQRAQR